MYELMSGFSWSAKDRDFAEFVIRIPDGSFILVKGPIPKSNNDRVYGAFRAGLEHMCSLLNPEVSSEQNQTVS